MNRSVLNGCMAGLPALLSACLLLIPGASAYAGGALVVVGGGKIPDEVRQRFITLSGGTNTHLLIIPQASDRADPGADIAATFDAAGLTHINILDLADPTRARQQIRAAQGVWIGGGQQEKLMNRLEEAGVVEDLRRRHREGVTFGGTSAGAAVMSDHMIASDSSLDDRGLGLWPEVIVDQHFVARKRFNRSLATVLGHPSLLGVGIDEGTAVVVSNFQFEVMGASAVTVIDARNARTIGVGEDASWRDVRLHWLRAGDVFSFPAP